ncbi:hypothetical protein MMC20_001164 [Loxospora ochrophaea]|nr:hypothetical protein [Loxospora ochrophaea]
MTSDMNVISNAQRDRLDDYVKSLLSLPAPSFQCKCVTEFYTPREGDVQVDSQTEKGCGVSLLSSFAVKMFSDRAANPQDQDSAPVNNSKTRADTILIQNGIDPSSLSPSQFQSFQQQNPAVQAKSIQVYAQNLNQYHHRSNPGMNAIPNQGLPLMQGTLDVSSNMQNFPCESPVIRGVPGPSADGNHPLQDYQMQLMLLEIQNKKRLLVAKQEADKIDLRPNGHHAMAGQPGFPPGMSLRGGRSGPFPNPSDQMKRGTPRLSQTGLPESPIVQKVLDSQRQDGNDKEKTREERDREDLIKRRRAQSLVAQRSFREKQRRERRGREKQMSQKIAGANTTASGSASSRDADASFLASKADIDDSWTRMFVNLRIRDQFVGDWTTGA